MTDQEIIDHYKNLLIIQYYSKPKARATIENLIKPLIESQLPLQVQDAFNVETAVGVQLDILGMYVGVTRVTLTFSGQTVLTDNEFRILVKVKLIQNNAGSSMADIAGLIYGFFGNNLLVFDYQNFRMSYFLDSSYGTMNVAEAFVRQGLLPKPMGVQLAALIYMPGITNAFGFRTYPLDSFYSAGFNTYTNYNTNRHWISYDDGIIFG